jgi:hypothetical protein
MRREDVLPRLPDCDSGGVCEGVEGMTWTEDPLIEERRIYVDNGEYWMVLTVEELLQWRREAPHLIRYVNGEPCSQIYRKTKES